MLIRFPVVKIPYNRNSGCIGGPYRKIVTLRAEYLTCMRTEYIIQTVVCPVLEITDVFIRKNGVIPNGFRGINKMGMFVICNQRFHLYLLMYNLIGSRPFF